jgi:hypothetical protein
MTQRWTPAQLTSIGLSLFAPITLTDEEIAARLQKKAEEKARIQDEINAKMANFPQGKATDLEDWMTH